MLTNILRVIENKAIFTAHNHVSLNNISRMNLGKSGKKKEMNVWPGIKMNLQVPVEGPTLSQVQFVRHILS